MPDRVFNDFTAQAVPAGADIFAYQAAGGGDFFKITFDELTTAIVSFNTANVIQKVNAAGDDLEDSSIIEDIGDNFIESIFGATRIMKIGEAFGTQVVVDPDPQTNLTDVENGCIAYDSTAHILYGYINSVWTDLTAGGGGGGGPLDYKITFDSNLDNVRIGYFEGDKTVTNEEIDAISLLGITYETSTDQGDSYTTHANFAAFVIAAAGFGPSQDWLLRTTANYQAARTEPAGLNFNYEN